MSTWECRACGEHLDHRETVCPHCGSEDVVQVGAEETSVAADEQPEQVGQGPNPTAGTAPEAGDEPGTKPVGTDPTAEAAADTERTTGEKALLGGIGLTLLGAFLPWITVSVLGTTVTKRGIDGDGTFTAAAAVIVAVLYLVRWGRKAKVASVLLGALVTLIAVLYISDPAFGVDSAQQQTVRAVADVGIGLYVTAIGGAAMTYGAYAEYRGRD